MRLILYLLLNFAIIGLFLYSKLLPYKDRLGNQYKSLFNFFEKAFTPLLNLLRQFFKPASVGQGLAVDMSQIFLLLLFLLILKFI
jgi:hypothetical protein